MSFLRLARNCGVFAKSFAPLVSDVRSASASIANRIDVLPSANKNIRTFSLSALRYCEAQADEDDAEETPKKKLKYDKPNRDRSIRHPVETSIEYMQSNAYETTYGNRLVWEGYRRVHKGGTAPRKTRKSCIRFGVVTTASPCPICRDEYLVFAHQNLALLKQFISPYTGEVCSSNIIFKSNRFLQQ